MPRSYGIKAHLRATWIRYAIRAKFVGSPAYNRLLLELRVRSAGRHERRPDSGGHVLMRGCGVPAGIVDGHPAIRSVLSRR